MAWENLTEYERGYLAAFIDGEGSICISKHSTSYFRPVCVLYNTHLPTMKILEKLLGSEVIERTEDKRIYRKNQTKVNYSVSIRKQVALYRFLLFIKPYLITKQEQCKTVIKILEVILNRDSKKYSKEDLLKMKDLYKYNKILNRGVEE